MDKIPSSWEGKSRFSKGQRMERGETFTIPDNSVTLKFKDDGDLILYQGDNAIWASNTVRQKWRRSASEYIVFQDDGNLVLWQEGEDVVREESLAGKRTYTVPYKENRWNSGTNQYGGQNMYLQLHPGKAVIYANGVAVWDSSKTGWKKP
jgi:hypothetical protein